jgi:hypothetical protein
MRCEECRWFSPAVSGNHGYCKIDPPVFTHVDEENRPKFFNPVVSLHGFCSNWEVEQC